VTPEQAPVEASRPALPARGRKQRKAWADGVAVLFERVATAERQEVPARLVLEAAAHDGDAGVQEVAGHALRALDDGLPVEHVLTLWTRVLDESWPHLGHRAAMPALVATSAASLRMHSEWSQRIAVCQRVGAEAGIATAAMRTTILVVTLMPLMAAGIVYLINPAFVKYYKLSGPFFGTFVLFSAFLIAIALRVSARMSSEAHPLTGALVTVAAHLDAGADPAHAVERGLRTLSPPPTGTALPEVIAELRARGIDPEPLALVAVVQAARDLTALVRARAVDLLYQRARELEHSRVALVAGSLSGYYVWGMAAGAAGIAAACALLLWKMLLPLL
jgi:hypothetical protein